jgi:S-adenosylmethionine:tRNA ribosyltransferase-isomerase
LQTSEFDFDLPHELVAQQPLEIRDRSRLLVARRQSGALKHRTFTDLPELLVPGDVLVRNNTKVLPARLIGRRAATGGHWEGLFLRAHADGAWEVLTKTRGHPKPGERIVVEGELRLTLLERQDGGRWLVRPDAEGPVEQILARHGHIPLPPYIRHGRDQPADRLRYQTLYAQVPGAVAAPTAGLHFTEELIHRLEKRGIASVDLTLHVGLGTFRPIETERIEDHVLHAEWASLSPITAQALNHARDRGGKIVAVGTTSVRTLETAFQAGVFRPFAGETPLYVRPGHAFKAVDALITNFHLPRSSLLVLVSAFAGLELTRTAYAEAVRERYRFYSYGDAMLIL